MKRTLRILLSAALLVATISGCSPAGTTSSPDSSSSANTASTAAASDAGSGGETKYPEGKFVFYGYGNPQAYEEQFKMWFERHPEETAGIEIEMVQCESSDDARKKVMLSYQAGAWDDLPDAMATQVAQLNSMAKNDLVVDVTDYLSPLQDELLDGATNDVTVNGKMYALPISFRPQVLYYNKVIFDEYDIDPARMDTFEGYIEVGRELKEKSNGTVYLSFTSPSNSTWGYIGRRGFWPQAQARIFDDDGNVVFGSDPGVRRAMETLNTLLEEDLLLLSQVLQPPLYDSTRDHEVATFYIGIFWDEFLRKNVPEGAGEWRIMPAPVYEDIGLRGAPVTEMFVIINKPERKYEQLYKDMWYDYMFDADFRNTYADTMTSQDMPCWNPLSKSLTQDDFWKAPDDYYGGQSLREMETVGLENCAPNMPITASDVEADKIIATGIDKLVVGDWDMETTIANIDQDLKTKIGKAE